MATTGSPNFDRRLTPGGAGSRLSGLLAIAVLVSGCAASAGLTAAAVDSGVCVTDSGDAAPVAAYRVLVDHSCTVRVLDAGSRVVAERALRPTGRPTIRRIVPASSVLFVLRANPGRLDAYRLPSLQPIVLAGGPTFRDPRDLLIRVGADGEFVGYVLDNPPPYAYHDSDLPSPQPAVLRFSLRLHGADPRHVIVASPQAAFPSSTASGGRVLESVELLANEVRVLVREDRLRYAEYFTDDGVLIDRVPALTAPR